MGGRMLAARSGVAALAVRVSERIMVMGPRCCWGRCFGAGGGPGENEMNAFLHIAADNSAQVLLAFLRAWPQE